MTNWELSVEDLPDPVPQSGQALTRVLACGICGSDLHVLRHGAQQIALRDELAAENPPDPLSPQPFEADQPVVMGHEFCCEVVELGPGCENLAVGDVVVSMPGAFDATGVHAIGYSNRYPGGYGELLVVNDLLALKVPSGLPARARGADRASGRRRPRRGQERDRQLRRRGRAGVRAGRPGGHRRSRRPRRGAHRRLGLLLGPPPAGRARGRARGRRPRAGARAWPRGGGSTGSGRWASSRP